MEKLLQKEVDLANNPSNNTTLPPMSVISATEKKYHELLCN
jgi:hypothetical protein